MTITLDLQPETERGLIAQAQSKGLSLTEHAREILAAAAAPANSSVAICSAAPVAANLYDLFTPVRALLTDEEVDRYFGRTPSASRSIDFG